MVIALSRHPALVVLAVIPGNVPAFRTTDEKKPAR